MASFASFDQLGNKIQLSQPPQRIVSLVPSQTELLHDLGLDDEVIGITKFCIHPSHWAAKKTIVGGTKNFWFDRIDALQPDLVIGNKEENYREGIEILAEKYPVWMSNITSLPEALVMIDAIGELTGRSLQAAALMEEIQHAFTTVIQAPPKKVLYLIWRNPWMAVGPNTFIDSMLTRMGLVNCLHRERYPVLTAKELASLEPEYILLSSEPYPFDEKHIGELKAISPSSTVILVDGEMFSWYGSRLRMAPAYFNSLRFS